MNQHEAEVLKRLIEAGSTKSVTADLFARRLIAMIATVGGPLSAIGYLKGWW